jgi:alpha-amylase
MYIGPASLPRACGRERFQVPGPQRSDLLKRKDHCTNSVLKPFSLLKKDGAGSRSYFVLAGVIVQLSSLLSLAACGIHSASRLSDDSRNLPPNSRAGSQSQTNIQIDHQAPAEGVVLQAFNWPFDRVTAKLPELARIGYTHIHVSPPSLSINRTEWWARYQPIDYRVIDGPLGNEESFRKMNAVANDLGVKILADVVLNHMANADFARYNQRHTDNPETLYYPDPATRTKYGLPMLFEPSDFNNSGCINDYNNRQQVVFDRLCLGFPDKGLPDLNVFSPRVIEAQRNFLRKLTDLGVDGFRIDALKHLPPESINVIFEGFDPAKTLVFGEIISNTETHQREIAPYAQATSASFYDFSLVFLMKRAFDINGSLKFLVNPVAVGAALTGNRAVTFVTNHDIPNNGDIFKFLQFYDLKEELLAYTYILGRSEGLAYVYTDLGRADGLESDRYLDAYAEPTLAKIIAFRNSVAGTPQRVIWQGDQALVWTRGGRSFVVMNKSGSDQMDLRAVTFIGLEDGTYTDSISGNRIEVSGEKVTSSSALVATRSPALYTKVASSPN